MLHAAVVLYSWEKAIYQKNKTKQKTLKEKAFKNALQNPLSTLQNSLYLPEVNQNGTQGTIALGSNNKMQQGESTHQYLLCFVLTLELYVNICNTHIICKYIQINLNYETWHEQDSKAKYVVY